MKVYLHMHNGNVQQNPLCVESCATNGFSISPRLSPTMFDRDANSVILRAHLCTAVDFMCRKTCVRNCSRERKGLYNGNVLLTRLYTAAVLIGSMYVCMVNTYSRVWTSKLPTKCIWITGKV